jgi:GNAT superfamily N-acetyltransferase
VLVRDATPEDAEAIVALTESGWREGYRGIVDPKRLADLPVARWRHEIGTGLRRPVGDAFTRVAEGEGGEVVGYCYVAAPSRSGELGPEWAELVAMYVAPSHWGAGAGGALMEAAVDRLAELPYRGAFLWTFAENERAIRFYTRHGWEPDGAENLNALADARTVRFRRITESAQ